MRPTFIPPYNHYALTFAYSLLKKERVIIFVCLFYNLNNYYALTIIKKKKNALTFSYSLLKKERVIIFVCLLYNLNNEYALTFARILF